MVMDWSVGSSSSLGVKPLEGPPEKGGVGTGGWLGGSQGAILQCAYQPRVCAGHNVTYAAPPVPRRDDPPKR